MADKNIPRLRYTGFTEHYELSVFGGEKKKLRNFPSEIEN